MVKAFPEQAAGYWALQCLGRSRGLQTSMATRSFFWGACYLGGVPEAVLWGRLA